MALFFTDSSTSKTYGPFASEFEATEYMGEIGMVDQVPMTSEVPASFVTPSPEFFAMVATYAPAGTLLTRFFSYATGRHYDTAQTLVIGVAMAAFDADGFADCVAVFNDESRHIRGIVTPFLVFECETLNARDIGRRVLSQYDAGSYQTL